MNSQNNDNAKITIPKHAFAWLEKKIGKFNYKFVEHGTKDRTQTWQITTDIDTYYFKFFRVKQRWQNEVFAYENWSEAYFPYVPKLCGVYENETENGILTSAINGIPLRMGNFSHNTIVSVYEKAGQLCRRLENLIIGKRFGLPNSDNELLDDRDYTFSFIESHNPVEYVRQRYINIFEAAKRLSVLESYEVTLANEAINHVDVFSGEVPVPVNSDYTPGNWLVDNRGQFSGVIDLEHLTWSIPVFSLTRLITIYFPFQNQGRLAFYKGYQRNLELEKPEQVKIVAIMDGLRYLVRGKENNDPMYISRGRQVFQKIDLYG